MDVPYGSVKKRAAMLFIAGFIGAVFVAYAYSVYGYRPLSKYPPDWTAFGLIKIAALLVATYLSYLAIRPLKHYERSMNWSTLPPGSLAVGVLIPLASAVAVLVWPDQISGYVREEKILSILTEVMLLGALFYLGKSAIAARKTDRKSIFGIRPFGVLAMMFGAVLFILLEEMSYGQHWLGFGTPDAFEANQQNETNLHNFYTHRFEAAYYSAAVLAFVALPFAWPKKVPNMLAGLSTYVPSPAFAIMALPLCGMMFETWNYVPYQFLFYFGLFVAAHFYLRDKSADGRLQIGIMVAAMLFSQYVFLFFGHEMLDGHELTEIREFAISMTFLAYGYVIAERFRDRTNL